MNKRKQPTGEAEEDPKPQDTSLTGFLETRFNSKKRVKKVPLGQEGEAPRILVKTEIHKGFYNLPREVIIERLSQQGSYLKPSSVTGYNTYYYRCIEESCRYKLTIIQYPEEKKVI